MTRHEFCHYEKGAFRLDNADRSGIPGMGDKPRLARDDVRTLVLTGLSQGLMHASERHGFEGEGFSYLKSPIWWGGVVTRREAPTDSSAR